MSNPAAPHVHCERQHPGLTVPDIPGAIDFYVRKLGFTVGFTWGDPPTLAGVKLGEVEIFLQKGAAPSEGSSVYFVVGDVDELYDFHRAGGVAVSTKIGDREYELRDYTVRDLAGHYLTFGQYRPSAEPALPIERVDVPVRLEKRLAAALADLAAHKHMSLSSCLEETLLHTFEPYGDGVASPHTKGDLRYIQQLKQKHGIDYDSHASYRFVERE